MTSYTDEQKKNVEEIIDKYTERSRLKSWSNCM